MFSVIFVNYNMETQMASFYVLEVAISVAANIGLSKYTLNY